MPKPTSAVTAAQWRRGMRATEKIGAWLKEWDERARCVRDGEDLPPRPARRRARSKPLG